MNGQALSDLVGFNHPSVEPWEMAEGVLFEPFLPSGDKGYKGGFATFQFKQ
jgi:hypothetical protein